MFSLFYRVVLAFFCSRDCAVTRNKDCAGSVPVFAIAVATAVVLIALPFLRARQSLRASWRELIETPRKRMNMLPRPLTDLSEQDFVSLVANSVSEKRDLDFKRDLPGGSDKDTKEFLADVTSFANAQGGDLVFGIEDRNGVAIGVPGIDVNNIDSVQLRLESVIRDGVAPRLFVKMHCILTTEGRGVLVIRIPASLVAPHRIQFKNSGRFWNRNSRGKYEMDVQELRHAFTESEAMPQRLRALHEGALGYASGINMPFSMARLPTAVVSIMPLGFLRETRDILLMGENTLLPPRAARGFECLPILEGFIWYNPADENGAVNTFALTHRTGRIDASWQFGEFVQRDSRSILLAYLDDFENGLGEIVLHGVGRLKQYGIEGPWVVMTTILWIKPAMLVLRSGRHSRPAWRDQARLPELILEQVKDKADLEPVVRAFWLLFGLNMPK
jgi:hypothetical protein